MALGALLLAVCGGIGTTGFAAQKEPDKPKASKSKSEKPFAQRLADHEIVFTDVNFSPQTADRTMKDKPLIDDPLLVNAVRDALKKLIDAHKILSGHDVASLPFGVVESREFNCSVPQNGSSITCSSNAILTVMKSGGPIKGMDQLAFLLGHELAHVTIASHRERFAKSEKLKSGWQTTGLVGALVAVAAVSDFKTVNGQLSIKSPVDAGLYFWNAALTGMDMAELANEIMAPTWSQANEDEADAYALLLMQKAGYDAAQAAPLLRSVAQQLADRHQAGGVIEMMAKEGAKTVAMRALLTNGDKLSMIMGGITGVLKGFTTATAHYHRDPNKRADNCANQSQALIDPEMAAKERLAMADTPAPGNTPGSKAPQVTMVSYTPPVTDQKEAVPAKAAPRTTKTSGKSKKKPATSGKVQVAAKPEPPKTPWARFYDDSWYFGELSVTDAIRDKNARKDFKGAAQLCPPNPRSIRLKLACAMAYIGDKNGAAAKPLLESVLASSDATIDDVRMVIRLDGAAGDFPAALRTLAIGHGKYPSGALYPDEIMVRFASGDVAGAKEAGQTCQQKAEAEIKDACKAAIASINKKMV